MAYAEDSAGREQRLKRKEKKNGESQTQADSRAAGSRVKTSTFVPFAVREAELRRKGYKGKDATRMANFQSSTAGQSMGIGGTNNSPIGGGRTPLPQPDPMQASTGQPLGTPNVTDQPRTGAPNLPTPSPVVAPAGQPAPVATLPTPALPSNVAPNSPQANFLSNKGNMTPEQTAQAMAYAKKMGTTFSPDTGYSRSPFENFQSNPSPALPEPVSRAEAIAAGEKRGQGYRERYEAGLPMSADAQAAITPPSLKNRTAVDAEKAEVETAEPATASSRAKLVGDAALPAPSVATPEKKSIPLYTGGDVVEKEIADTAERKKAKVSEPRRTEITFNGPTAKVAKEAISAVKEKAAPNIEQAKQNIAELPSRVSDNVDNAKKSYSEGMEKVNALPGVKQVRAYLKSADQRKAVSSLNRRMKHKLSAGKLEADDIKRYKALAKESGVKFDELKGFYL